MFGKKNISRRRPKFVKLNIFMCYTVSFMEQVEKRGALKKVEKRTGEMKKKEKEVEEG